MGNLMSRLLPRFFSFFQSPFTMPSVHHTIPPHRILVLGGGYGGLAAALNLHDLCNGRQARASLQYPLAPAAGPRIPVDITIVDERDGYYHVIGSPLAFASEAYSKKAWVKYSDIPILQAKNIHMIQGSASKVDCNRKVATIMDSISGVESRENYDFLVVATGLRRAFPAVPQSLTKKAYLYETEGHLQKVKNATEGVVVIGGGAVGIEMATELKLVEPTKKVTLIQSRDKLLSSEPLPDDFKDRVALVVQEQGVELILGHRVITQETVDLNDGNTHYKLTMSDGSEIQAGHVIWAISQSIPTTAFLPKETRNEDGYIKINSKLNIVDSVQPTHHFAVGDACAWSGIKRCGGALHMGHLAGTNIYQQLRAATDPKYVPQWREIQEFPAVIALAVGKLAVMYGPEDGTTWGEDEMKMMFGDDLGWTICWNYLGLGKDVEE